MRASRIYATSVRAHAGQPPEPLLIRSTSRALSPWPLGIIGIKTIEPIIEVFIVRVLVVASYSAAATATMHDPQYLSSPSALNQPCSAWTLTLSDRGQRARPCN
jgi:hypothetical protein